MCTGARTTGSRRRRRSGGATARSAWCRAVRTSGSAAAARCSTCTSARRSRPSSARSRMRCGISARSSRSSVLRPIEGPAWGYRQRARLSVRHVVKKGKVLVGFHERKSSYVADMDSCEVLPRASERSARSAARAGRGDGPARPPAADRGGGRRRGDRAGAAPPRAADAARIASACARSEPRMRSSGGCSRKGRTPCTVSTTAGRSSPTALPEFGIRMPFKPTDFTQVNQAINQVLVGRALRLLDPKRSERVIDWFCGLGNFTLAARDAGRLGARHRRQPGAGRAGARGGAGERCRRADRDSRRATCSS